MVNITDISKSQSWGNEVDGQKRYFAVVTLSKGGANKFVENAIGSNHKYKLSIDIKGVYLKDEDCQNEGEFSPNKAFQKFSKEYDAEGVNLFDIDLKNEYKVISTGRPMKTARVAIYGDKDDATKLAFESLERDLKAGRLVAITNEKNKNEDEEE